MPAFILVILVGLFLAWAAPSKATVLQCEIEHSDVIPPIEGNLQPGDIFDKGKLPNKIGSSLNDWYRIPNWLAGTWHREMQTDYYRFDYASNSADTTTHVQKAISDGTWGTQSDAQGNVWQFDPAPYSEIVDAGSEKVIQIIRIAEPVEMTAERFVKRSVSTQLRVDKATGTIKGVETGEQITTITPQTNNLIRRETSSKVFDHTGKALLRGKSFSLETRTTEFEAQNFYRGQDMRQLFQEFMKLSGATAFVMP